MPISFYSVDLHSKKNLPVIYSGILMKEMLEFLSHAESSTIYHHPAWLQALSIESNQEAFYIIQRNNKGEIVLILPLLKTRGIPFGIGGMLGSRRISSLPRTPYAGPIGSDISEKAHLIDILPQLFDVVQKHLFQIKTLNKSIDLSTLFNAYHWRNTFIKTLNAGSDKIIYKDKRSEKDIDRMIKKAKSYGVKIYAANSLADLKLWYKLYLEKMRHHSIPPRPIKFFIALWENMDIGKMIRLNLAYINNSKLPIGGNLSFVFKDTFYAGFKGGLIKNMKMMYDDFLWDFEIRNAQMEGLSFFDLGEVPQNHTGLKKYKKKWGAKEIPIYHLYPENAKIIKSEFDSSDQDTGFRKYWNVLPIKTTAFLGGIINSFL